MYRRSFITLFAIVAMLISSQVAASSFRAMPLRLHLNNKVKTEVLRVVNEGNKPVTVQIGIKSWKQDVDGKDLYEDSQELIVFPRMANIEGGDTKIFRVGYSGASVVSEKSFRIFVQELPVSEPGEAALKFALNLSLPVFVEPQSKPLMWDAHVIGILPEAVQVMVENSGSSHLMVNEIKVTGLDNKGKAFFTEEQSGWYTLSGAKRTYEVAIPYQQCLQAEKLNIDIKVKGATKQLEMPIEQGMCSRKPKNKGVTTKTNYSNTAKQ